MQPKKITSPHNQIIKTLLDLRESKHRRKQGKTIVEGVREVSRALESGINFDEIIICPELFKKHEVKTLQNLLSGTIPVFEVSEEIFQKMSFGDRLEGILAICPVPQLSINQLKLNRSSIVLVAEGIEKPGNLGAILRTAEAAGVSAIIVCDSATDIYNPNVIRASLGSVFLVPTVSASKEETLAFLRKNKVRVCATWVKAEKNYTDADLRAPVAFVLGSEQKGLSPFWAEQSDIKIKIPMKGMIDSLNVSVTAAVIIYESIRQQTQSRT